VGEATDDLATAGDHSRTTRQPALDSKGVLRVERHSDVKEVEEPPRQGKHGLEVGLFGDESEFCRINPAGRERGVSTFVGSADQGPQFALQREIRFEIEANSGQYSRRRGDRSGYVVGVANRPNKARGPDRITLCVGSDPDGRTARLIQGFTCKPAACTKFLPPPWPRRSNKRFLLRECGCSAGGNCSHGDPAPYGKKRTQAADQRFQTVGPHQAATELTRNRNSRPWRAAVSWRSVRAAINVEQGHHRADQPPWPRGSWERRARRPD
jgi:hypothetical protein